MIGVLNNWTEEKIWNCSRHKKDKNDSAKYLVVFITTVLILFSSVNLNAQKFNLYLSGGFSYRFFLPPADASTSYKDYLSKKRKGISFSIEPLWYSEGHGIGFQYSNFHNSASGDNIKLSALETHYKITENININYYSLQYHNTKDNVESSFLYDFQFGMGVIRYRSSGTEYISSLDIKAKTYGLNTGLTIGYKLTKYASICISNGVFLATIGEIEKNGHPETLKVHESISHYDLNGSLRINF